MAYYEPVPALQRRAADEVGSEGGVVVGVEPARVYVHVYMYMNMNEYVYVYIYIYTHIDR